MSASVPPRRVKVEVQGDEGTSLIGSPPKNKLLDKSDRRGRCGMAHT
jgi:hypothetical protein